MRQISTTISLIIIGLLLRLKFRWEDENTWTVSNAVVWCLCTMILLLL